MKYLDRSILMICPRYFYITILHVHELIGTMPHLVQLFHVGLEGKSVFIGQKYNMLGYIKIYIFIRQKSYTRNSTLFYIFYYIDLQMIKRFKLL